MSKNELQVELDTIKAEYLNPTPDRLVDRKMFSYIADYVVSRMPTARSVLELGVGDQVWTSFLLNKFEEVTTIDASQTLLDLVKEQLSGRKWTSVCSFFEDYEPKNPFDVVFATYVLEHVDDAAAILMRARQKWMREGGRLVVAVPHALSLHRRLAVKMGMNDHEAQLGDTDKRMGHKRCFTYYELERDLANAGFSIVESRGMFTKVLPNGLLTHLSDAQLKGLFELGLDMPIEYSAAIYIQAQAR